MSRLDKSDVVILSVAMVGAAVVSVTLFLSGHPVFGTINACTAVLCAGLLERAIRV